MKPVIVIEELNGKLFERTCNEMVNKGYELVTASISGYSMTKYVAIFKLKNE